MRIKLCGLRTEEDVLEAVGLKVDAVGFMLAESPRQITADACAVLRDLVPDTITVHGVFAHASPEYISDMMEKCRLDVAQIHGNEENADYWRSLGDIPVIRAFRIKSADTLKLLEEVSGRTFLLDAFVKGKPGGTGCTFDWHLAAEANAYGKVILAGGLTPENVADAIRTAKPWMVDVSSGIEKEKGVKDIPLMRAFVAAVRGE